MKKNITFVTLMSATWMAGPAAAASLPIKAKEWTYVKKSLDGGATESCLAETNKKVGELVWTFSVVVDPTRQSVPAIYVSHSADDVGATLNLQTDSSRSIFTVLRDREEDARWGATVYWFAPDKLSTLVKQIRRDSNIKVTYSDTNNLEQKFYFSLAGSMATLDNLNKNCDGNKEVIYPGFFDALDKQIATVGEGAHRGVDVLKTSLALAWETYLVTGAHQKDIDELDAQIKPLVQMEKDFLTRSGKLSKELEESNGQKAATEAKRAGYQSAKVELGGELRQVEAALSVALTDLQVKADAFRPAAEEAKPYFTAVETAGQAVEQYARRMRDQEAQLRGANAQLTALEKAARSARSDIDDLDREERDLTLRRSRAQSDLNGFNYQWELRRSLETDTRYRWLEGDIRRNEQNIVGLQQNYRNVEAQLRVSENDLRRCESRHVSLNASLKKPRPEPKPDPKPVPKPPRPPRPDCSRQQAQVQAARRQVNNVAAALAQEQRNLNGNRANLDRRRYELETYVNARFRDLQQNLNQINANLVSVQASTRLLERELNDINHAQIPRQRAAIAAAQNEIASLRGALQNAEQRLADKRAELRTVTTRNGYESKKIAFEGAETTVANLRGQASKLDTQIKFTDAQIATQDRALTRIQAAIDELVARLAKETRGLEEVEATLEPLRVARVASGTALVSAQTELLAQMTNYRTIYRNTMEAQVPTRAAPTLFYDWRY